MNDEPHIGKLIREELKRQGRSVSWLARNLNCSRQNVYRIFEQQWIYTDVLLRICDLLGYDFFRVYSEYWKGRKCNGFVDKYGNYIFFEELSSVLGSDGTINVVDRYQICKFNEFVNKGDEK